MEILQGHKVYNNIRELPIENYEYMYKYADYRYLIIDVDLWNLPEIKALDLSEIMIKLEGQIIIEFGLDVRSQDIILLRKKILEAKYKVLATGKKIFMLPAWEKELLFKTKKQVNKQSEENQHIILSQWARTNTRKVSVFTFLSIYKMYQNEQKQKQQKQTEKGR